jgi:hypothetical protein
MKNGFQPEGKRSLTGVERQRMVLSDVERFLVVYERNRQIIERVLHR